MKNTLPGIKSETHILTMTSLSPTARRILSTIGDLYTPEEAREYLAANHPKMAGGLKACQETGADRMTILRAAFKPETFTTELQIQLYALAALALS